jgi:hypothetical protein
MQMMTVPLLRPFGSGCRVNRGHMVQLPETSIMGKETTTPATSSIQSGAQTDADPAARPVLTPSVAIATSNSMEGALALHGRNAYYAATPKSWKRTTVFFFQTERFMRSDASAPPPIPFPLN